MNKEKDLDDLFRKKLQDPVDEIGYREADWAALEEMLDGHKKRKGIVFWLPYISGAAALLLLFLGWWMLKPRTSQQTNPVAMHPKKIETPTAAKPSGQDSNQHRAQADTAVYAIAVQPAKAGPNNSSPTTTLGGRSSKQGNVAGQNNNTTVKIVPEQSHGETLLAVSPAAKFESSQIAMQPITVKSLAPPLVGPVHGAASAPKIKTTKTGFRPQYAISALAAPDVNGVGSFQNGQVGGNFGLMFSANVFKKLVISTGVLYSYKPYLSSFEDYHTPYHFPVAPSSVSTVCRMLDIPVNVSYQVFNQHQNKIYVGTGLSSYVMLHQNYTFNYTDPYATGPSNFAVNKNVGYPFGVLNLNVTYQHQLNSKLGLSFQPYMKIPLTNVGYSQVKLQSTGLAIGLNWNLGH